jgi:uncharacterized membrane protein
MGIYTENFLRVTVWLESNNDGHFTRFQASVVVLIGSSFPWVERVHNSPEERIPQFALFLNTLCVFLHTSQA